MRWLLLLLTLVAFQANARVELQSVYFIGQSTELTEYSSFILERLKSSFTKGDYQIIEVNSYSTDAGSTQQNVAISQRRLNAVFSKLEADSTDATINAYGNTQIPVNFKPVHWNRVDIYYSVLELWKDQESPLVENKVVDTTESDSLSTLIHTPQIEESASLPFMEIPAYDKIPENEAVPLSLHFGGNKVTMKNASKPVLDQLYRTLIAYPNLKVHIRGHVCCGKNKRISSKRARYVYKYLRKRGVSKDRISYKGYSNTLPLVFPERTDADRSKNRRVDVIYTK
ncbi:MAG: OmpA family protein [Crocinitomicaceae bacterium]